MTNYTRLKMLNNEKTIGTFFELGTANAVEGLRYSGLDYIIIALTNSFINMVNKIRGELHYLERIQKNYI